MSAYPGEHHAIVDTALFEAVQARLTQNLQTCRASPTATNSLLLGKIFDDRGNKMSPTYSRKGKLRYRYYVSRALVEGRRNEAGSVRRVPAQEVEAKVLGALRALGETQAAGTDDATIIQMADRIKIEPGRIVIELIDDTAEVQGSRQICISWAPQPTKAKRQIILPHIDPTKDHRPIQVEQRDRLLRAMAKGRLWLKELTAGQVASPDAIAAREGRSKRSVHMTLSLAFVAPDIVEAAVAGALPRGIGLTRLMDLPPLWSEQRKHLGLKA